jgi:hypothetical protein
MLQRLKRTVARVDVDGKPTGTAFLVSRTHVATAAHVVDGGGAIKLVFVEWPTSDRTRKATAQRWRHPAGYDVAILELDRPCPASIEPLPWRAAPPDVGAVWSTFGFPSELPDGYSPDDGVIRDPALLIDALELRVLQLGTPSANDDLGGLSGAPCTIGGAIVGVLTHQLKRRAPGSTERTGAAPSLATLYAMPMALFALSGISSPTFDADAAPAELGEVLRLAEELAQQGAKASALAAMLRTIDRAPDQPSAIAPRRAEIARKLGDACRVVVHLVWRSGNDAARLLAHAVYRRFTRSSLAHTSPGLRIPTFLHDRASFLGPGEPGPIDRSRVEHTLIVVLRDDRMVLDRAWRGCLERIASAADEDAEGISILPVDLELDDPDKPRAVAQFKRRRVIGFGTGVAPARLLIAIEERVLSLLARRRGAPRDQMRVRLFVSYATLDGAAQARSVWSAANALPGIEAEIDDAALAPGERIGSLVDMIEGRLLLAVVTPQYVNRPWCRRELLAAKQLGCPIVVVNAQDPDLARAFPYLGNVPWVQWRNEPTQIDHIIEAATFEFLRDEYVRIVLADHTLLDEQLQHAHIVTRPPELLDVTAGGSLARNTNPVVLHPDPPISDEEQELLRRVAPEVRFVSPGQAVATAQPLRWASGGALRLALSASPSDLQPPGVSQLHFEDAWLDLTRLLVLGGSTLVFGGDLRRDGLTDQLLELAEQRAAIEDLGGRRSDVPIVSCLGWPLDLDLTDRREAELVGRVEFKRVVPPPSVVSTYPETKQPPTTPDLRYLWARSMTRMRRTVLDDVDAMVVIGGKAAGFAGRYAGVFEEILLAIRRGTPVFLLGGFGGAAAAVAEALTGGAATRLSASYQLDPGVAPAERGFVDYYNAAIRREDVVDEAALIDHDAEVAYLRDRGLAGLNNGLSDADNRLLVASPALHEVTPLLLKGLRGLLARGQRS